MGVQVNRTPPAPQGFWDLVEKPEISASDAGIELLLTKLRDSPEGLAHSYASHISELLDLLTPYRFHMGPVPLFPLAGDSRLAAFCAVILAGRERVAAVLDRPAGTWVRASEDLEAIHPLLDWLEGELDDSPEDYPRDVLEIRLVDPYIRLVKRPGIRGMAKACDDLAKDPVLRLAVKSAAHIETLEIMLIIEKTASETTIERGPHTSVTTIVDEGTLRRKTFDNGYGFARQLVHDTFASLGLTIEPSTDHLVPAEG
ncbi:hypothetical protein [Myceligenerans pegani]|uniref:Uncharacterized protein n=1 Tax=Myceligenerans pegani TaxID=2776917 RepID=A0ABR9N3W7_9MICO|nr:hypothetical protein [Myceligenerans sp. TRM 65318]MBE1878359.1 hypothetical protein [Myceligenerans sp. TRM 65318]MBE3020630.1 hypothetical protein [Myceligenerans sp. TRM 65318]